MADDIDFSFFDEPKSNKARNILSDEENDKNLINFDTENSIQHKNVISSSDNESTSTHSRELYSIGNHDGFLNSNDKDKTFSPNSSISNSSKSSTVSNNESKSISDSSDSTSDHEISKTFSDISSDSSSNINDNSLTPTSPSSTKKEDISKQFQKPLEVNTSSSSDSDTSDSMTDVSPLISPENSPNLNSGPSLKSRFCANKPKSTPYQHITKLNVVFKDSESESALEDKLLPDKKQNKLVSSSHKKQNVVQWSSESDDEDFISSVNIEQYLHEKASKNAAPSHRSRHENAAFYHRQRLLDSAATGSKDISSLLETVLEFEKQNKQKKIRNCFEMPMNYRIGEKFVHSFDRRRKKNMSFSNEKVREIDLENQRLLKKITNQSRPSSASSIRSSVSSKSGVSSCSRFSRASSKSGSSKKREPDKPVRLYHSALNRLQFQKRIERENMQLLKRLQSAKPTPGLQRQQQLNHYKQQNDYMGTTINRNGMSLKKATELTRNAEVVQRAIGLSKKQPARPAWQDRW